MRHLCKSVEAHTHKQVFLIARYFLCAFGSDKYVSSKFRIVRSPYSQTESLPLALDVPQRHGHLTDGSARL